MPVAGAPHWYARGTASARADIEVAITITRYSSTDKCVPPPGGCKVSIIGKPNSAICTIQVPHTPRVPSLHRSPTHATARACPGAPLWADAVDFGEARCLTASVALFVRRKRTWT